MQNEELDFDQTIIEQVASNLLKLTQRSHF
jgi:hypothetical protein